MVKLFFVTVQVDVKVFACGSNLNYVICGLQCTIGSMFNVHREFIRLGLRCRSHTFSDPLITASVQLQLHEDERVFRELALHVQSH